MNTYIIDDVTASQNETDRMHRWRRKEYKTLWYWLVKIHCGVQRSKPSERKILRVTRVGKRLIDDQNLSAGMKYLVDALVEFNHLKDDSPEWVAFSCDQRKCVDGEKPHMIVTIS